jgi:hypothetical protein
MGKSSSNYLAIFSVAVPQKNEFVHVVINILNGFHVHAWRWFYMLFVKLIRRF